MPRFRRISLYLPVVAVIALVIAGLAVVTVFASSRAGSPESDVFGSMGLPDQLPRFDMTAFGEEEPEPQGSIVTGDVSVTLDALFGAREEFARYPFVPALESSISQLRPVPEQPVSTETPDSVAQSTPAPSSGAPAGALVPGGTVVSIPLGNSALTGESFLLDPGHGIASSPGVRSTNGLEEAELVLDISKRLSALLQAAGAKVYMTRETSFTSLTNQKRAELANKLAVRAFIRIHAETYPDPTMSGVEVMWSKEDSATLADMLLKETSGGTGLLAIGTTNVTGFMALMASEVPAVQVSVGALSNPLNESFLRGEEGRQRVAEALYKGLVKYAHAQ